jgi:hypothetical protein
MNKMNKKGKIIGLSLVAIMVVSLFAAAVPSITAQGKPDLVITKVWTDGGKLWYTIANQGTADAPGSRTGVYIAGRYVARGTAGALAAGTANDEVIKRYNSKGGETVCADYQKRVDESDETNNCNPPGPGPTPPTPPPPPPPGALPDLVVSAKWETIEYNGQIVVHFTVKNIGNADAGESTACKYINGIQVGSVIVPALGDGTNFTAEFDPEDCPPGTTFDVTVCADNYDDVAESDETNNCMTNVFTCPPGPPPGGPDLVISKTVERRVAGPNLCQYRVEWTATNIGNELAGWNTVALFINGIKEDEERCSDLGQLASDSGDFWRWLNCPPACGTPVNVEVRVDYFNEVAESNEDNNNDTNIVDCQIGDIEVTKEVWDGADWVEEIDAEQGDDVLFRCIVHNSGCCCDLDDITVTDVLSDSLEYINAFPAPDEVTTVVDGATTLKWVEADPLEPCEVLVYFINARVIGCGVDTNTQSAVATDCTGEGVSDDDTATVNAPPEATLEVTKQVRLAGNVIWRAAIDVPVGTLPVDVEFRCTVHNDGTCCDLNQIEVWDVLRDQNLVVTRAVGPAGNPRPPIVDIRPDRTIVYWYIPDTIEYCDELVFRIDANIAAAAVDDVFTNTQRARAWSPRMKEYAGGWDVATVTIVA